MTEENKVKESGIHTGYGKKRGQVVRKVTDHTGLSEADIRFSKKTGEFFAHVNDIEYSCSEIDPLEEVVKKLLVTLRDIDFDPVISLQVYQQEHSSWYSRIITPEKPSGQGEVEEGVCAFGFVRFYIGQNKHTLRLYAVSWEEAERIEKRASIEEFDQDWIDARFQGTARQWATLKQDGKETLVYPIEIKRSTIMLYTPELWETLEAFGKAVEGLNEQLAVLIVPDVLLEIAASGKIPQLSEGGK